MIDRPATLVATRRLARVASALLILSLGQTASAQDADKEYAQQYVQPFKGIPKEPNDFTLMGPDAEKCTKFEPGGLRITLPTGHAGDRPATGLLTTFGVRGDFEITLSYEILQEPAAADAGSGGTRLTLGVLLHTAERNLANFSRKMDMKDGPRFAAWVYSSDKKPANKGFLATTKTGRLRLTRAGNVLSYHVAEGADKDFKLLHKLPFGAEDVREVRITGATGGDKAALDVRVTDLRIRAAALVKTFEPLAPPPLQPAPPPRDLPERVAVPFRDGIDNQPLMRLYGPDAMALMTRNEQGMRFNLPNERRSNGPVGVESQLRLRGDFEITFSYELLALPDPPPKFGAGVELWVKFDTSNSARALLSRVHKPEGAFFVANHIVVTNEKDAYNRLAMRGAKEAKGQLRLSRLGKKLIYQIADGVGGFLVLATKDSGADDVIAARVWASTGWQAKSGVDTRFGHLEIRAEQILKSSPRQLAEGVEYQLREGIEKQPGLQFVGADAAAMAKADSQGLRFLVPDARKESGDVGVESLKRLRGDFEITMHYELLNLPDPPPKLGAGVVLQIQLDTPDFFKARFGRARNPSGTIYGANYLFTKEGGTEEFKGISVHPADDKQKRGALRLVRTGNRLDYQIADGPAAPFLTIESKIIGTADVISARALCYMGYRSDVSVDIRLSSFELRADQFVANAVPPPPATPEAPVVPAAPIAGQPEASSRTWLVTALVVGLAFTTLLAIAGGAWFFLRRSSGVAATPAKKHEVKTPAPASFVSFLCPDCGKKLKVKQALAGKKVKCTQCGKAVLVAEDEGA